jgi:ferrous iron transport protein B
MFTVFTATFFFVGQALSDLMEMGITALTDAADSLLTAYGINPVVHSLVIDGVFAGVGSVLTFLPLVVVLFFFLSILEDTGYMSRIAFVMDKLLRRIGLSGRSIVPMLIGFGCTVPAVMATRTLSSDRDRKMTVMLTPFMSCSAKIPIYAVFAQAFFPNHAALVMTALYFGGILVGIIVALILNRTAFKGSAVPFVMELPNYRFPSVKSVLLLMWEKAKDFITKAFTVIFVASVIIWFLGAFDMRFNPVEDSGSSILAMLGRLFAPIFAPLGLSDWRIATSLLAGLSAKEAVVSTLAVLMNTSVESLATVLPALFTVSEALAFLTFTLLYTPCIAAIATVKREMKSTWKTIGIVFMQCAVAWICALAVSLVANLIF